MNALGSLAITHGSMALLWAWVAARRRWTRTPAEALVAGYLFGATLLIAVTHALGWFGSSSRLLAWLLWFAIWGGFLLWRRTPAQPPSEVRHGFAWQNLGLACLTLLGAGLLLADPWRHVSPASVTACHFVTHLSAFLHRAVLYGHYIVGLPVLLGQTRLDQNDALELMRWGPPLLAATGIPAFFVFFSRAFGRKTGALAAVLLAGSFWTGPIVGFQILFPQFASAGLALPALLFAFPRALRTGRRVETCIAAAALLLLAFTGTYFAILVAAAFSAWLLMILALRRTGAAGFIRGALLLAIVPLCIGFHYGVAAPRAEPQKAVRPFTAQIESFARNPAIPSPEQPAARPPGQSPVLHGLKMFLAPKRLHLLRPTRAQTFGFWLLPLLALPLLKKPAASGGLLGFAMLFSTFATITGMFDMPGYQGRHLFLMLLLGIPVLSSFAVVTILRAAVRLGISLRHETLFRLVLGAALLSSLPTIRHPPEAGKNIPVSPDLMIRQIPEDDLLIGLARTIPADQPQSLVFLARPDTPRLPGELLGVLNRTPGFSGLQFHRTEPARLAGFSVFRKYPPRFAALARADWDALGTGPVREWNGLVLGEPLFMTARLVCVRLAPD